MAGDSATFDRGVRKAVLAPFRSVFFLVIAFVVLLFGRMVIDLAWTGADPTRLRAAQDGFASEIAAADALPPVGGSPAGRARRWALTAYDWCYVRTGVARILTADPAALTAPEQAIRRGADSYAAQPHWQAVMLGTQTLAARAATLPSALPTLAIAYLLASLDGLVARFIRRAAGGRESATRYHRAKYFHVFAVTVALLFWLWWPAPLSLTPVVLTVAAFGALFLRIQFEYFKKYL